MSYGIRAVLVTLTLLSIVIFENPKIIALMVIFALGGALWDGDRK